MTCSLTVFQDYTRTVHVHSKTLDISKCSALKQQLTDVPLMCNQVMAVLQKLKVCPGNPDKQFLDLGDSRKGSYLDARRNVIAIIDDVFPVVLCMSVSY